MAKPQQSQHGMRLNEPVAQRSATSAMVGDTVLVKTSVAIGGATEHAAIVTCAHSGGDLDILLIPRGAQPYPVSAVKHANSGASISWRHRT